MPGILAFLEDAILNDTAPVVAVKDHKRIADRAIGQVDRAVSGWHAIVPAAYHDRVNGLALIVAPMGVLRLLWLPITIIGRQSLNAHQFGAQALLCGHFAMTMVHHPLAH